MPTNECKWCGQNTLLDESPASYPHWTRWVCSGCGSFGYVQDPSMEELDKVYQQAWGNSCTSGGYATGSTNASIAESLLRVVKFDTDSEDLSKCLDYGGGNGELARVLIGRGVKPTVYEPYGTDPQIGVDWLNVKSDIPRNTFDWIFMIEVVEHLLQPRTELEEVYEYLAPGGKLVITTPNAKGWRARLQKGKWREAQNPTHINLFSDAALRQELESIGFVNLYRVCKPMAYNKKGVSRFFLNLTQIFCIDGGLKFVAERPL